MPRGDGDDTLTWKLNRSGVCSFYNFLSILSGPPTVSFPWKSIWSIKVPNSVSFFFLFFFFFKFYGRLLGVEFLPLVILF